MGLLFYDISHICCHRSMGRFGRLFRLWFKSCTYLPTAGLGVVGVGISVAFGI